MSQAATKNFLDGCSLQQDEKEAGLTLYEMFSITGSLADVRLIICLTKLILSSGNEGRALSTARADHVKHS